LGSTCNHVAAVLFKVEHAWKMGWTNKACTSKPCVWNQPAKKQKLTPKKSKDMEWRKPHHSKKGTHDKQKGLEIHYMTIIELFIQIQKYLVL